MTRWSLFLQTLSLLHHFLGLYYGAMGGTRDRTLEIASLIKNRNGIETAHHLTCVGLTRVEVSEHLTAIHAQGIENIVALRGDPPQGETEFRPAPNGYSHGGDLARHIKQHGGFGIAVAGYPEKHLEAPDFETDLRRLRWKVDQGADVIITQLFYDNRHFYEFVEMCRKKGIDRPIVPGLMPILNVSQIKRITQMCGATIPPELLDRLSEAAEDDERVHELGIAHAVEQARDLLDNGVAGLHFYVLNQYFHIAEIMDRLRPFVQGHKPKTVV